MPIVVFIILVGLLGGMAVGLQGPMTSMISQRLGILESAFIVHLGGAVVALALLLVQGGGQLSHWRDTPRYTLGAGVFGLAVIAAISFMIPRIGAAPAIVVLVAGQLLVSAIMDHFGLLGLDLRPMTLSRLVGLAVVFVGVWLTVRK
jgi:bacterial/archaeal transporter family-2 protein